MSRPATASRRQLIPDFLGLKGDTSDDIPGIPGIGDKTASDLLVRFGSLEGIYANLPAVPGEKRRLTLAEHRDSAFRSRDLATIERDLDLDVDVAGLIVDPPDRAGLKEVFRRFEFRALLRRIDELDEAVPAALQESEAVEVGVVEVDEAGLVAVPRRGCRRPASPVRATGATPSPPARVSRSRRSSPSGSAAC